MMSEEVKGEEINWTYAFSALVGKRVKFIAIGVCRSGIFNTLIMQDGVVFITLKEGEFTTVVNFGPGCALVEEELKEVKPTKKRK